MLCSLHHIYGGGGESGVNGLYHTRPLSQHCNESLPLLTHLGGWYKWAVLGKYLVYSQQYAPTRGKLKFYKKFIFRLALTLKPYNIER